MASGILEKHKCNVDVSPVTENDMEIKRFTKNDSGFTCAHCGKEVGPLGYTSRNHCPFCLWSLHVDVNPGDRANECGGPMEPVATRPDPKAGFVILHRCTKCGELCSNKAAYALNIPRNGAKIQADNTKLLISFAARPWTDK